MNEKYIETAITLSRLYGIAETLHPWAYLENHRFCDKIRTWTEEYFQSEQEDILSFFESKVIE